MGKRPTVENTAEGNDPVMTEFNRAKDGEGVGQGPISDDDAAQETAGGEAGQRRPPGAGGPVDGKAQGQPRTALDPAVEAKDAREPAAAEPEKAREVRLEQQREERAAFAAAAEQIKEAVKSDPALADLAKQLAIDITPQGLRIQILDEVRLPILTVSRRFPDLRIADSTGIVRACVRWRGRCRPGRR